MTTTRRIPTIRIVDPDPRGLYPCPSCGMLWAYYPAAKFRHETTVDERLRLKRTRIVCCQIKCGGPPEFDFEEYYR